MYQIRLFYNKRNATVLEDIGSRMPKGVYDSPAEFMQVIKSLTYRVQTPTLDSMLKIVSAGLTETDEAGEPLLTHIEVANEGLPLHPYDEDDEDDEDNDSSEYFDHSDSTVSELEP